MSEPFSKRFSFERAVPIRYRQEAPRQLRQFLRQAISKYISSSYERRDFAYLSMDLMPPDSIYRVDDDMENLINTAPWYLVYDSVERLYDHLLVKKSGNTYTSRNSKEFLRLTNALFEREGFAWRLGKVGRLEFRGEESFDAAVSNALIALKEIGSDTGRAEIHKALEDLARRPEPDLSGAVQHAMAGLECVANQVCGTSALELGKVIKKAPQKFPPPLNEVIPQLYGFASNNGRHLTEGEGPEFAEAELLVGIAATVSTYLARKVE